MQAGSPFGQYAAIVAAFVAGGVLAAWLVTAVGWAPQSDALDAVALLIVGVIFGTGAGASVVANGAGRQAQVANTRLDAVHAPHAELAERVVAAEAGLPSGRAGGSDSATPGGDT